MEGGGAPPAAVIFHILQGDWIAQCLKAVTLLGIHDVLESGPKSIKEIAEAAKVNEDFLHRVMRILSANGVFVEDPDTAIFSPTPVSKALLSGVRGNSQALVKLMAHESHTKPWEPNTLAESIRSGKDGFQLAFGQGSDFWSYTAEKPDIKELFWQAMESTSTMFHTAIVSTHDFSQYKKLVDVGGGFGTLLRNILHKTPSLQGVLFDLPHVVERATIREDKELEGRVEYSAGSFFESVYEGADCYISTTVLHDWNDLKAGQILDSIHKAAPQGAKLLLGETVVPNDTTMRTSKLMSVHMMTMCDGKERTAKEWTDLLAKHGFKILEIVPTVPPLDFHLIVAERV